VDLEQVDLELEIRTLGEQDQAFGKVELCEN
jgi:hypothetical protein